MYTRHIKKKLNAFFQLQNIEYIIIAVVSQDVSMTLSQFNSFSFLLDLM